MSIQLNQEPVLDVRPEMLVLLDQHYQELTLHKDKIKLNPMWELYDAMEKRNEFFLLTARIGGELVGYSAWFLKPHIHYRDTIVASNDVIFMRSDQRQGIAGIRLIKYSEQRMKELGANKIVWHIKNSLDFSVILHRMGYIDEDIIVGKML
jgi:hypothetical protein